MSYIQRILQMPRSHGEPCPRLLARAAAFRGDAAEVAAQISELPAYRRADLAMLVAQHQALILRAQAAALMAHDNHTLAREYVRSARRLEVVQ